MMHFRPNLASTENVDEGIFSKLVFPYLASPKIDGIRCLCSESMGPVTRALKPVPNNSIREFLSRPMFNRLDGELIASYDGSTVHDPEIFNKTQSAVMRQSGSPHFYFYVFDLFTTSQDSDIVRKKEFQHRYTELTEKVNEGSWSEGFRLRVRLVEHVLINNIEELLAYEQKQVSLGFEGIMLRSLTGVYKHGRSTTKQNTLLKMKRFVDAEAIITGWKPLQINDNEKTINELGLSTRSSHKENKIVDDTRVGVFETLVITGDLAGQTVDIGSGVGLTHDKRRQLRLEIDQLIENKAVITFKYQNHGVKDKPRIPIFKSINKERQHLADPVVREEQERQETLF